MNLAYSQYIYVNTNIMITMINYKDTTSPLGSL